MKIFLVVQFFLAVFLSPTVSAQSTSQQFSNNIELLRRDPISMLNKTAAMPPVAQAYVAAKARYDY